MENIGDIEEHYLSEKVEVKFSCMHYDLFNYNNEGYADPPYKFDTKHPENNVRDMAISKDIVRKCRSLPLRYTKPLQTMKVQLEDEKMKLYFTQKKLDRMRAEMDVRRASLIQQWKDLEEKEEKLRQNFIRFNEFVRENHDKRIRGESKLEDDKQLLIERQIEINRLQTLTDSLIKTATAMDATSKKYRIYTMFMGSVLEHHESFHTINDIIERYNVLLDARDWLSRDQKSNMSFLENAKNDMMKLIEEKNFVIMGLNNQIANLQARYENANIKALESEELVTEIKNNAVKQLSEIDTVKNSIWNVYVHMASSKKHPIKIKKDNVEEQMMYINRTLTELSKVNKLIKKKSNKMK